jgi:hypothetical protein
MTFSIPNLEEKYIHLGQNKEKFEDILFSK